MIDEFDKIFENIKHESLSEHERSVSRENLKLFMAEHPARTPFALRIAAIAHETLAAFRLPLLMRLHPVALSLVLVLCVGVGTSYAAEGALPGDTLYPVKINVNEQVQGALALSPQAKADWHATRVARRLEEAETLAVAGRLSGETSSAVQSEIESSSEDFNTSIAVLAKDGNDPTAVVDAQSNLEATLNAHARVLAALSQVQPEDRDHIAPILATIEARVRGAARSRREAEVNVGRGDGDVRAAAVAKKNDAEGKVSAVRTLAAQIQTALGASTSEEASTSAFRAEQVIEAGKRHLDRGDYGGAFNTFEAAIRTAQETKVNVDAHVRLGDQIHIPFFSGDATSSELQGDTSLGDKGRD
jgi:hypothetical protein